MLAMIPLFKNGKKWLKAQHFKFTKKVRILIFLSSGFENFLRVLFYFPLPCLSDSRCGVIPT